ncbi:MAG: diguanylate cyclase [Lachnospiraceae bacterium]|nr:diguanylate cyclase [Lachnospiraceae bacterium]
MNDSFYYSGIALIAILLLLMQNYEILLVRAKGPKSMVWKDYRNLLCAVLLFHFTDVIWGIFYAYKVKNVLFVDSLFYFGAMALCVLFWTRFAVTYLAENSAFGKMLIYAGQIFFLIGIIFVIANIFRPILFMIDDYAEYHETIVRWIMHCVQIVLLVSISIFGFVVNHKKTDMSKKRYRTIAWFGLIMAVFLFVQLWNPLLPLYTVAYMLGICMVRTFVVIDEKEEYRMKLERSLERERRNLKDLKSAREAAYKDPLTGVRSKGAFVEFEKEKDIEINKGDADEFAVAVFDLNGLKIINDNFGHKVGDEYIKTACGIICERFKHSPVFRIGGDEFVAILEHGDYENREKLEKDFIELMEQHKLQEKVVVAIGMADYIKGEDYTFNDVFSRADRKMYMRKRVTKGMPVNRICANCEYEANCPSECEYSDRCKKI